MLCTYPGNGRSRSSCSGSSSCSISYPSSLRSTRGTRFVIPNHGTERSRAVFCFLAIARNSKECELTFNNVEIEYICGDRTNLTAFNTPKWKHSLFPRHWICTARNVWTAPRRTASLFRPTLLFFHLIYLHAASSRVCYQESSDFWVSRCLLASSLCAGPRGYMQDCVFTPTFSS
jgi:hypothetical protein